MANIVAQPSQPLNDKKVEGQENEPQLSSWPIPELQEDLHFYMENGYMVFTQAYHQARGTCCGNACRHCPFEHENVR